MDAPKVGQRALALASFAALVLGIALRAIPAALSPVAMGDGGLFAAMMDDVVAKQWALPAVTSYNHLSIPFVYPPAAIYVADAVAVVTGASALDVIRFLPPLLSIGVLLAFAAVAHRLLPPVAAVGATFSYAVMPHAFDWLVSGGGLTRGFGLLFAVLAIGLAARRAKSVWTGALLGIAGLAHPQAFVFGTLASAWVVLERERRASPFLRWAIGAGTACVVVMSPWLGAVATEHGLDTLLAASHRSQPIRSAVALFTLEFSGAAFMDVVTPLAVIGLVTCAIAGLALPIGLLVIGYVAGPGGGDFIAAVPWALVAGFGVATVVSGIEHMPRRRSRFVVPVVVLAAVVLATFSAFGSVVHEASKLQAISLQQRTAMSWVRDRVSVGARFLVATQDVWGNDEVSEWFPAISDRTSLGTVQGSEWLGADGYQRQLSIHNRLIGCMGHTADCYRHIDDGAFLFIPKGRLAGPFSAEDCCPALRSTLASNGYEIIYDGPGATIARPSD